MRAPLDEYVMSFLPDHASPPRFLYHATVLSVEEAETMSLCDECCDELGDEVAQDALAHPMSASSGVARNEGPAESYYFGYKREFKKVYRCRASDKDTLE